MAGGAASRARHRRHPTQEEIDRWTAERTLGLIKRFPIELTAEVVCLLASALATKVSWEVPFDVVDAAALGPGPWSARLRRVLRPPRGDPRHRQYLAGTDRAGTVGVHLAGARGGLLVGSVIAADPAVPPGTSSPPPRRSSPPRPASEAA
jgi:hypothetical protein